ncbi:MAG: RluA family pseudouridine synthase [Planctomycetota bacterium]|nr:RluA family pseudouridine synthase [Planctomycetota bacterium]
MQILYEDNHLIFVNKPAGMLAQGDISGDSNLVDILKSHRKRNENKPGEAYVGLVHRLDRPVSGVMVLAKTSKAAQRLNASWHSANVIKCYRAVVRSSGLLPQEQWTDWVDELYKDPRTNMVRVVAPDAAIPGSQTAGLRIRTALRELHYAELEIELGTGRGHQIRVQLQHRRMPIVGDVKYGSKDQYLDYSSHPRVALHAYELTVPHPTLKKRLCVRAPWPRNWPIDHAENSSGDLNPVLWIDQD